MADKEIKRRVSKTTTLKKLRDIQYKIMNLRGEAVRLDRKIKNKYVSEALTRTVINLDEARIAAISAANLFDYYGE